MWCGYNAWYDYENSVCTCFDYYSTYDAHYEDCFCDGVTQYDAVLGISYCSFCDFGHDEYGNCLNDTNNHTCDVGFYFDEWTTMEC
jgi:hypothetical protein